MHFGPWCKIKSCTVTHCVLPKTCAMAHSTEPNPAPCPMAQAKYFTTLCSKVFFERRGKSYESKKISQLDMRCSSKKLPPPPLFELTLVHWPIAGKTIGLSDPWAEPNSLQWPISEANSASWLITHNQIHAVALVQKLL
jgi:hypothetical protein